MFSVLYGFEVTREASTLGLGALVLGAFLVAWLETQHAVDTLSATEFSQEVL